MQTPYFAGISRQLFDSNKSYAYGLSVLSNDNFPSIKNYSCVKVYWPQSHILTENSKKIFNNELNIVAIHIIFVRLISIENIHR